MVGGLTPGDQMKDLGLGLAFGIDWRGTTVEKAFEQLGDSMNEHHVSNKDIDNVLDVPNKAAGALLHGVLWDVCYAAREIVCLRGCLGLADLRPVALRTS
jgi:hypothetical protein